MCALVHDLITDASKTVEDDCACATFNVVDAGAGKGEGDGGWDGKPVDLVEGVGCHDEEMSRSLGFLVCLCELKSSRRWTFADRSQDFLKPPSSAFALELLL